MCDSAGGAEAVRFGKDQGLARPIGTTQLTKENHAWWRAARRLGTVLRQCLDAAIADNRIAINPAISVPLLAEPLKPPRFLSQSEVEQQVDVMPDQCKAMVLSGAFAGLRWGEAAGLRALS
jgi:integrase